MTSKFEFAFPVTDDMKEYLAEIVEEISRMYGVSESEALAIVSEHWASSEIGPDDIIGHEEPDYWARQSTEHIWDGMKCVGSHPRREPDERSRIEIYFGQVDLKSQVET